jgi:hypothetical protein
MKRLRSTLLILGVILTASCESRTNVQKLDQVILLDVQGLWGGTDLWISADGFAVCRFVLPEQGESGLEETRYAFVVSEVQCSSLLELINKHSFFTMRTKDRYGVPDEARPNIFVKSGANEHAVGKWANDKHQDFDPIYQLLLKIAESGKKGTEIGRGAFDWNWKPDGFPENWSIWNKTGLKVRED